MYLCGSFDKFSKFPWNGATIHLMTRHLERSTLRTPSGQISARNTQYWSRLSQSLQNTHWWRQWLPHLTRISSHWTKFLSLGTERSVTQGQIRRIGWMRNQFITQFVVLSLQRSTCGTACCLEEGRALFCAPISLQMTTKRELCVLSDWNLAWRGSKSGSFEMSRHQMDCSAISWKFTKLIKWPCLLGNIF